MLLAVRVSGGVNCDNDMKIDSILFDKRWGEFVGERFDLSKDDFHKKGQAFLKSLAKDLHLDKGTFNVRSLKGGDGILGEVILHSEHLYIQVKQSHLGLEVLYRTCSGMKDYSGGSNQYLLLMNLKEQSMQDWFVGKLLGMSDR